MNYFAHGWQSLHDPYFLAGTALPDWLGVVDRRVRVRSKHAQPFAHDADPRAASLARGIVRHHQDDAWFHASPDFLDLTAEFSRQLRARSPGDDGPRPSFLAHVVVELLLDAALMAEAPERVDAYYGALVRIDAAWVEQAVNRMAPRPAERLARFIGLFLEARFLPDYVDDAKLAFRLDQVLARVGLVKLDPGFVDWLPEARRMVEARRGRLLPPPE